MSFSLALSPNDRKTLLIGVSVVVAIVVFGRGVPWWYRWQRDVREEAVESAMEAEQSRYAVRNRPAIARMLRQGEQRYAALGDVFLDGDSPAAAATALTSVVSDAAGESGIQIGALQPAVDSSSQTKGLVSVRGSASGDIRGVTHFLSAVESGMPLLSVREVTVTQSDPSASGDRAENLRLDFVIDAIAPSEEDAADSLAMRGDAQAIMTIPPLFVYDPRGLGRAADSATANDLFRLERKPARVAFGAPPIPPQPTLPPPPRIRPTLGGIVGGPPWKAVLANIPGREGGVIVATGDTVAGLTVRAVRRDEVIVKGVDTTWTLTTRR